MKRNKRKYTRRAAVAAPAAPATAPAAPSGVIAAGTVVMTPPTHMTELDFVRQQHKFERLQSLTAQRDHLTTLVAVATSELEACNKELAERYAFKGPVNVDAKTLQIQRQ